MESDVLFDARAHTHTVEVLVGGQKEVEVLVDEVRAFIEACVSKDSTHDGVFAIEVCVGAWVCGCVYAGVCPCGVCVCAVHLSCAWFLRVVVGV